MIFWLAFLFILKNFSKSLKAIWNELPKLENLGSILPGKLKKDHLCKNINLTKKVSDFDAFRQFDFYSPAPLLHHESFLCAGFRALRSQSPVFWEYHLQENRAQRAFAAGWSLSSANSWPFSRFAASSSRIGLLSIQSAQGAVSPWNRSTSIFATAAVKTGLVCFLPESLSELSFHIF